MLLLSYIKTHLYLYFSVWSGWFDISETRLECFSTRKKIYNITPLIFSDTSYSLSKQGHKDFKKIAKSLLFIILEQKKCDFWAILIIIERQFTFDLNKKKSKFALTVFLILLSKRIHRLVNSSVCCCSIV